MSHPNTLPKSRLRLPAAAAAFATLVACQSTSALPEKVERFPADLAPAQLEASGMYPDGWTSRRAAANLKQPTAASTLRIRGTVPLINDPAYTADVVLLIDDAEVGRRTVGVGDFQLSAPLTTAAGKHRVGVLFTAGQQLPGGDGRDVGARLSFLGFEKGQAGAGADADILQGDNVRLGAGWGELETFKGERFRWIENDARLVVTPRAGTNVEIVAQLEAGPGVEGKCLLKILNQAGQQVAASMVAKRQTVRLWAPAVSGQPNEFTVHVDGGGHPTPNDRRILNVRFFKLQVNEAATP
jgi:hypothetical protein